LKTQTLWEGGGPQKATLKRNRSGEQMKLNQGKKRSNSDIILKTQKKSLMKEGKGLMGCGNYGRKKGKKCTIARAAKQTNSTLRGRSRWAQTADSLRKGKGRLVRARGDGEKNY